MPGIVIPRGWFERECAGRVQGIRGAASRGCRVAPRRRPGARLAEARGGEVEGGRTSGPVLGQDRRAGAEILDRQGFGSASGVSRGTAIRALHATRLLETPTFRILQPGRVARERDPGVGKGVQRVGAAFAGKPTPSCPAGGIADGVPGPAFDRPATDPRKATGRARRWPSPGPGRHRIGSGAFRGMRIPGEAGRGFGRPPGLRANGPVRAVFPWLRHGPAARRRNAHGGRWARRPRAGAATHAVRIPLDAQVRHPAYRPARNARSPKSCASRLLPPDPPSPRLLRST